MSLEPLTLELIEGGKLKADFGAAFEAVQSAIMAHCDRYGSRAEGAVASLSLTIKLKAANPVDFFFEISSDLKITPPARPQIKTSGVGEHRKAGQPIITCRSEGTDYDDPRQSTIFSEAEKAKKE